MKNRLEGLKKKCCKSDLTLLVYYQNENFEGIVCTQADVFMSRGSLRFTELVLRRIKENKE